jgi:AraC-like DNA-binding protein
MTDPTQHINDFLRRLHLGSGVFYVGQLCDAWHMSTSSGSDTTAFHLVCHGEAWIHMPNMQQASVRTGDIIFLARDVEHTLSGKPYIPDQPCDISCPAPVDKDAPGTGLLCGHLKLPAHIRRLLLAALTDEHLRPAVTAFIDQPAETWTVERLAGLAFQSRSAFSERFTQLVRMTPMEFVATWRMQLAVGMLATGQANMLDIAMQCGYESEAAFRKAFKRIIGVSPGKVRG